MVGLSYYGQVVKFKYKPCHVESCRSVAKQYENDNDVTSPVSVRFHILPKCILQSLWQQLYISFIFCQWYSYKKKVFSSHKLDDPESQSKSSKILESKITDILINRTSSILQ